MATNDHPAVREWQHRLLLSVSGLLVFETLSGLSIYLLPFSIPNQILVILHTVAGVAFIGPYLWYQIRHWKLYRKLPMTHVKLTGYFSMGVTAVAVLTGVVLTWQAIFATRISYAWDLAHVISTFALIAAVFPHVAVLLWRNLKAGALPAIRPILRAQNRFLRGTGYATLALLVPVFVFTWLHKPVPLDNELPADYNFLYGEDRPFAPSLARTAGTEAIDSRALGGSQSCGRSGCHGEIVKEWEVSAHRYAAKDPAFRAVQKIMGEQNGAESTRYCGGCHDPISLFSGTKNLFTDDLTNQTGLEEGVSCIACHAIKETDVKGNAAYVIASPERYMFELHEGKTASLVSDFLIRAYPRKHVESLQHKLFKSPEFCGACHKQFIDEEINNVGWVQLQNQYDNWRKSRWNHPGDPTKTVECRECHMPLIASFDPGKGDDLDYNRTPNDGKHRSHRFLGANQFVPKLLDLPGAEEHTRLTEAWLRGEVDIPEIAHKWKTGPAVPIELIVPERVEPGEQVPIQVHITNNKPGHDFPTGPLDIIQSWIELVVTDQEGKEIFASGLRDEANFIQPGSFMFKAEPVDQYGNLIDRHNLWEMVGVRYRRNLFPGFSDKAEFVLLCPVTTSRGEGELASETHSITVPEGSHLRVTARLYYRKIDQTLLNVLYGAESGLTSTVTEMASDERIIPIGLRTSSGPVVPASTTRLLSK